MAFDRRALYFVGSKTEFICDGLDIQADSDTATAHLQTVWDMTRNQPLGGQTRFIKAVGGMNECLIRIRMVANGMAGRVELAPAISPDQLSIWTRSDGAVIAPTGAAA